MTEASEPREPPRMRFAKIALSAVVIPIALLLLLFWPAGRLGWRPGWYYLGVMLMLFTASTLVLARANPAIFRARSRFQTGTERWDFALLALLLPAMAAILPVSALDAGRFGWSDPPRWLPWLGYGLLIVAVALQTWAQAVNPFFEQGVRLQTERHQRVIETGPYAIVRHPGYASALLLLSGSSLALGSWYGLAPAGVAIALLAIRTALEDRLLMTGLPGYADYARRTSYRLVPGLW